MNEQQNLSIVRKAYDAFGRGDISGLLSLLDDRVSWVTPGPADLPTAGTRKGHDAERSGPRLSCRPSRRPDRS